MLIERINQKHKHSISIGGSYIHQAHTKDLRNHAASSGIEERVNKLLVTIYINALNFDAADALFSKHIKPYIATFGEEDMQLLIEGIGNNNQTYLRGRANSNHSMVVDRAREVIAGFDVSKYDFLPQPK